MSIESKNMCPKISALIIIIIIIIYGPYSAPPLNLEETGKSGIFPRQGHLAMEISMPRTLYLFRQNLHLNPNELLNVWQKT